MKAFHTCYAGDSGSGKTTLMREGHDKFAGLSIWVAHKSPGGISGDDLDDAATVRSRSEARRSSARRLRWVTETPPDRDTLAGVRQTALDYADRTGWPVQVNLDESQGVLNEELPADHPVKKMLHEDRDRRVKLQLGTQDPTDWQPNYSAIKQARYFVFVGAPSPFHEGFARYFSLPKNEFPNSDYEYVVFEKGDAFEWTVAARGETKEVYG